jgi:hypothetical protein
MTADFYVHGYSPAEAARLADQGETLAELLHHDTHYAAGSRVPEAGCGVGAQAVQLPRPSSPWWKAPATCRSAWG